MTPPLAPPLKGAGRREGRPSLRRGSIGGETNTDEIAGQARNEGNEHE